MNDKGKLNIGVMLITLFSLIVFSLGVLNVASRAQDNGIPKPPVLQADPPSDSGDEPADNPSEKPSENPDDEVVASDSDENEESTAPPSDSEDSDVVDERSHRDRTPQELSSLGVFFKDDEGSSVAERTNLIKEVNLPSAMARKNDSARSFQTMNIEGRLDPLYVTDWIPDALRPELEGEGISGAVDSGLLDQLIQTQLTTIFKYIPIQIIGTMQNGPYKSALVSVPDLGIYQIMKEYEGTSFPMAGSEQGVYYASMTITQISEDHVTIVMSATLIDYVYRRTLASTPSVTRHFYIRRYQ
ncbi:MAG: hypothetical protein ABIG42_09805 [bacterium]